MPELPEVETITNDLKKILPGMKFLNLQWTHQNSVKEAIKSIPLLKGQRVKSLDRRGKFINIFFEKNFVMTIHLRMSGRLIFTETKDPELKFERTIIEFDKGYLKFCDIRKFGKLWINKIDNYEEKTNISNLGIEPFSKQFTFEKFYGLISKKRGNIKKLLLDQSLVAGIGNIYADEACFYAGIKPETTLAELNESKLKKLFEGILVALKQGIKNRGTSISDFVDAYGSTGRNQELLFVYGRGGKPCLKCSNTLQKTKIASRGTVYCETCQE